MKYMQNILENEALINGIFLIISVVLPIMVMIFTLRSQNKRLKEENEIKERQFKETLQRNDRYHDESVRLQGENNRISQIPFLFLNHDIKIGNRQGKHTFVLEIINIGNGTALDVSVKCESDREGSKVNGLPFVYKDQIYKRVEIYRYTGFLFTNAIPIDSKASFELLLDVYENDVEVPQEGNLLVGEVRFKIKYKDIYYNEYEQDYMFQYSLAIGVGRVESYLPRLVKQIYGRRNPNLD